MASPIALPVYEQDGCSQCSPEKGHGKLWTSDSPVVWDPDQVACGSCGSLFWLLWTGSDEEPARVMQT